MTLLSRQMKVQIVIDVNGRRFLDQLNTAAETHEFPSDGPVFFIQYKHCSSCLLLLSLFFCSYCPYSLCSKLFMLHSFLSSISNQDDLEMGLLAVCCSVTLLFLYDFFSLLLKLSPFNIYIIYD